MTVKIVINRPWLTSFDFKNALFYESRMEQIHKLTRNFVASLDLGCPSVRHVNSSRTVTHTDEILRYKFWIKDWKKIYKELSKMIRTLKVYRKTVNYPKQPSQELSEGWATSGSNMPLHDRLRTTSHVQLGRLQETAMAMLNARYNAKLAAGERRRRSLEKAAA